MSTPAQDFLNEIEAFLKRTGMSATAFGRDALKDPNFVHDLRAGRMPNLGIVERVNDFIRARASTEAAAS
jgi:hypothetical protein